VFAPLSAGPGSQSRALGTGRRRRGHTIDGTARGSIVAREKIEIHSHGRVFAKIQAPVLKIEEGAQFQGDCSMDADKP